LRRNIGIIFFIVFIIGSAAPFLYLSFSTFNLTECEGHYIKIPAGATLKDATATLEKERIIDHPYIFMILVILMGGENSLIAGTYCFEGETSLHRIADILIRGKVANKQVTIPEGLTFTSIADILSESIDCSREEITELEEDPELLAYLDIGTGSLEGFLFPDTYHIPVDITPPEFLMAMIRRYKEVFNNTLKERAEIIEFSEVEIVILASIIEKETKLDSERKIISGVFHNRMKRGIPLEADPTVRYALQKYTGRLLYKDLEVDSPYNTYKYKDLPPGPICSPGEASIQAALYPDDVDYLYFVAAGDGTHIFTRTLAKHNEARKRVKSK
jgi:UPF0755 protein